MPLKRGAGGRLQNYNPRNGRFAKNYNLICIPEIKPTKKEKALRKEEHRREALYNRAKNSRDKYLFETYLEIEKALPGSVRFVNEQCYDENIKQRREIDIITKKCIIEVKSGKKVKGGQKQFLGQQKYAGTIKKQHIVFAPNMLTTTKMAHERHGIKIARDYNTLINYIKEYEK